MIRKLTHEEVVERQKRHMMQSCLPFSVLLNDIRSAHNVGSIFRTADGAGVGKLWLCGITAQPPNAQLAKTALGSEDHVQWEYRKDPVELVKELRANGTHVVLLEQMDDSVSYQDFVPEAPLCLVVGNEVDGVSDAIVEHADAAIEIGMDGIKNSLNVSVAFGIVAYHIRNYLRKS